MVKIDWSRSYQVWEFFINGDKGDIGMLNDTWYFAPRDDDGSVNWHTAQEIAAYLSHCRKFELSNHGVWFIYAPNALTDDMVLRGIKCLIRGATKTASWQE